MKEIICDTNVWYDLPEDLKPDNAVLIPTFCNIFELAHTFNLGASVRAVDTLHKGKFLFNTYNFNPFAHIMWLESGKAPYLQAEAVIKDSFLDLAKGKITKEDLNKKTNPALKEKELKDIARMLNSTLNEETITIENDKEKAIEWTKVYISYKVTEWAKTLGLEYYMKKSFDWDQIELFLNTLSAFIRKVVFNKVQYSHKDMFDLWNMVYVKPGNQYWTWEGIDRTTNKVSNKLRWHNLITEAGMAHYLFLPS